jgi:hypothetical protein
VAAAQELGDPAWTGAARFVYTLSLPLEATPASRKTGELGLADLQGAAADPNARQMLGQVHLSAALSSAVARRPLDVEAHLREAEREAASLGGDPEGTGFNLSYFGPTNIRLWKMSVFSELGEYGKAMELAKGLRVDDIPVANRRQSYHMTLGRALAHGAKTDKLALVELALAERAAPAAFRLNPLARDIVSAMINRAKRRAVAEELAAMAPPSRDQPSIAKSY